MQQHSSLRGPLTWRARGLSTVTFALIAPVVLMVLFGTMEAGRVMAAWLVITNEAREGARYGSVNYGLTDNAALGQAVVGYLDQRLNAELPPSGLYQPPLVVITPQPNPVVDVTVYYRVNLVTPLISSVLPNPLPLSARSEMHGE
jgi:Flp pilus assembly protein TadG